jgi:hypothetical protein
MSIDGGTNPEGSINGGEGRFFDIDPARIDIGPKYSASI